MEIQLGVSFIAGLLTTLSPCVLPILPFLIDSAYRKNKLAPLFMVLGLAMSFVTVGFLLSRFGSLFGLQSDTIRKISALILAIVGIIYVFDQLEEFVSDLLTEFSSLGTTITRALNLDETTPIGSVLIGALLGLIWSPCAGPALGVAVSLASQEGQGFEAIKIMSIYSLGAIIPMLLVSYGLRAYVQKNLNRIFSLSEDSKKFFGLILLITGVFVFLGIDKIVETFLLNNLPDSWVNLITNY